MVIARTKTKLHEIFVNGIEANPDRRDLLERLQGFIEEDATPEQVATESRVTSEVVFEVKLNGFCYTLTRSCIQLGDLPVNLSYREQEIARLVSRGLPNKAIAAVLEISPWTVSTHLRRIFAKLDVSTRAEMVASVLQEGLLGDNVTI